MFRFLKKWPLTILLVGAIVLGVAGPSRAAFKVRVTLDGVSQPDISWDGVTKDAFGGKEIDYSQTFNFAGGGKVQITFTASTSNQSGGLDYPQIARIEVGGVQINNTDSVGHQLIIAAADQDFNFPQPPPLIMHTTASGTVTNTKAGAGSASINLTGHADASNVLFGTGFTSSPGQTMTFPNGTKSSSDAGDLFKGNFNPSGDYSLTNVLTFNLVAGMNVNAASGTVEIMTPVPAGLALAGTGCLPLLGCFWWRRRQQVELTPVS
jgi:hypothetical protein